MASKTNLLKSSVVEKESKQHSEDQSMAKMMKSAVFVEPNRIALDEKPIPDVGPLDALIRITTTTICGTDVHILKGEYQVDRGLTIGHEPVGDIEKPGPLVAALEEGRRVMRGFAGWGTGG